jgi:hypothetical protein
MINVLLKKGLVCGTLVLFLGMSIVPIAGSISIEKEPSVAENCYLADDCYPVFNGTMGHSGWFVSPVNVSFVYDPDIVMLIFYKINEGIWTQYTEPFTINEQGLISFEWFFKNYSGDWSDIFVNHLKIDYTPPMIYLYHQVTGDKIVFTAHAVDTISGIGPFVEFYFNDVLQFTAIAPGPYQWTLQPIAHHTKFTVKVITYDGAGNMGSNSTTIKTVLTESQQSIPGNQQSNQLFHNLIFNLILRHQMMSQPFLN